MNTQAVEFIVAFSAGLFLLFVLIRLFYTPLKLALKLQQTMEVKYPTLARPLSLMSKNYNQSLTKGSLLIEFGTDANSLDEAKYSAELVGESLSELLKNLKE